MATRYMKDEFGRWVYYDEPKPLTPEQTADLVKVVNSRLDKVDKSLQDFDAVHVKQLEAKRLERLTREAYESLTPEEQVLYDREHHPITIARRLAEAAQREVEERWQTAEREREFKEMQAWKETQSGGVGSKETYKKLTALSNESTQREQARQEARARRGLEAETESDELHRVWATLDEDERKAFTRLLDEQPNALERIERFKAEHRNPIADIDDPAELYRLAMSRPKREKSIPPTSDVEQIEDPRTLYAMHKRDTINNKR